MLAFTYIPVAAGGIVCLLLVRYVPRRRRLCRFSAARCCWGWRVWVVWWLLPSRESNLLTPAWFQEMLGRLRFTQNAAAAELVARAPGLLEAARPQLVREPEVPRA